VHMIPHALHHTSSVDHDTIVITTLFNSSVDHH
jgi:hypothetical protein